jgi:hypothetical protein
MDPPNMLPQRRRGQTLILHEHHLFSPHPVLSEYQGGAIRLMHCSSYSYWYMSEAREFRRNLGTQIGRKEDMYTLDVPPPQFTGPQDVPSACMSRTAPSGDQCSKYKVQVPPRLRFHLCSECQLGCAPEV